VSQAHALLAVALLSGGIATTASAETAAQTIAISGEVPVICRASMETQLVAPAVGRLRLGTLREFCNNPSGYQVAVDHSPELAGATLLVDGRALELSPSGTTVVSQSDGAAIISREISLSLPEGAAEGSISFRISPAA
jgi:hypothetical protein